MPESTSSSPPRTLRSLYIGFDHICNCLHVFFAGIICKTSSSFPWDTGGIQINTDTTHIPIPTTSFFTSLHIPKTIIIYPRWTKYFWSGLEGGAPPIFASKIRDLSAITCLTLKGHGMVIQYPELKPHPILCHYYALQQVNIDVQQPSAPVAWCWN